MGGKKWYLDSEDNDNFLQESTYMANIDINTANGKEECGLQNHKEQ